jgi:DNA polymerase-3 subunit beta
MKFIISSSKLYRQLDILRNVIGKNKTLPILNCIHFQWKGNELSLTATDLEASICSTEDIVGEGNGKFAASSGILLDTIKHLPEQPLTLTFLEESSILKLSSSYGEYQIAAFKADDYPKVDDITPEGNILMNAQDLCDGINATLHCISSDEMSPNTRGMFFSFESDTVVLAGTENNKLVEFSKKEMNLNLADKVSFIVPTKPLSILKNHLVNYESDVSIDYTSNNVKFSFANISITARLIDGKYPAYKNVIPNETPNILKIKKEDFLGSLKRISNFSETENHSVTLNCKGQALYISAENVDFSNKAHEQLESEYNGDDTAISFNSRHLISLLENLTSDEVKMMFSLPIKPALINSSIPDRNIETLMLLAPINQS